MLDFLEGVSLRLLGEEWSSRPGFSALLAKTGDDAPPASCFTVCPMTDARAKVLLWLVLSLEKLQFSLEETEDANGLEIVRGLCSLL